MENVEKNGFLEMSQNDMVEVDGGAILELTIGAKIAIGLFATGTAIGITHALLD